MTASSSRRRRALSARSRFRRAAAVLTAAFCLVGVAPASALAYWDYTGYLSVGAAYGEGQAGTSGDWHIRLSRSNCNARVELRIRSSGVWDPAGAPGGCATSDWVTRYGLTYYDASHAINVGPGQVWVNVRIDATV